MAPHVLYVAWGFPPCRGSGVHRALATANLFARDGWRVTVLTADRETFERFTGTDPSLEPRIDPSVTVVRVPFQWPVHETDLRRIGRFRAHHPRAWRKLRLWRDRIWFPELGYGPWRRPLERAARRLHRRDPVDLVVATANPSVAFTAARALHRRARVPYVMDYRDAWALDVFDGGRLVAPDSRAARLERRYLRDATEVWFVNDPIRQWHVHEHPDVGPRMHVVANGWDADALAGVDRQPPPARDPSAPLRFGYLGTISAKVPVTELLAGWRIALAEGVVPAGSHLVLAGYLGFFATPTPALAAEIARAGDTVSYPGPVPKAAVADFYAGIDVAVLALGTGRYVTSGKVFEYVATGKPVVSVHDPANAASDVLRDYPLWAAAEDLTPESVARALGEAARLARTTTPEGHAAALAHAEQYRREAQLLPRIRALREVIGR